MNKYHLTALILGSSLAAAASAFAGAGAGAGCDGSGEKGGHGPGARFSQIDTNQDGKISLAELTASRETWLTRVDANKDGVATEAEIAAAFTAERNERMAARFANEDANKDGRLTRDETHMPSAWFERADTNKDGALTIAELTAAHQNAGGEKRHADARGGKGRSFDQNGDGKVERKEIQSAVATQFARMDENHDGSLTADEFRTRGHGKHHRGGPEHGEKAAPAPVRS